MKETKSVSNAETENTQKNINTTLMDTTVFSGYAQVV